MLLFSRKTHGISTRHSGLQADERPASLHRRRADEVPEVLPGFGAGYVRLGLPMPVAHSGGEHATGDKSAIFIRPHRRVRHTGDSARSVYRVEGMAYGDRSPGSTACRSHRQADHGLAAIFNKAGTMTTKVFIGELLLLKWVRHASLCWDALRTKYKSAHSGPVPRTVRTTLGTFSSDMAT